MIKLSHGNVFDRGSQGDVVMDGHCYHARLVVQVQWCLHQGQLEEVHTTMLTPSIGVGDGGARKVGMPAPLQSMRKKWTTSVKNGDRPVDTEKGPVQRVDREVSRWIRHLQWWHDGQWLRHLWSTVGCDVRSHLNVVAHTWRQLPDRQIHET